MSSLLVIDASVALKWVVSEAGSDEASALLIDLSDDAVSLVAPEHLVGEVGNGLRRRVAQDVLVADDAVAALDAVVALDLQFVPGPEHWVRSLRAALDWGVTTYDALYVLLALNLGAELVTASSRLVDSARRKSLPVRPLAAEGSAVRQCTGKQPDRADVVPSTPSRGGPHVRPNQVRAPHARQGTARSRRAALPGR